jgi:ADP-ribose pyrophosphatase YjhB (NUDIX family)
MIEILKYNDDDLKDNEIDEVVTRVKAFIVSSKNNMLVGKDENGYQLLGGYVEANEDLSQALAKHIYNETGIILDSKDTIEPFYEIRQYNRDYKGSGINRMSDLIYFLVKTDKLPNYKRLKLSERELAEKTPIEVVRRIMFHKILFYQIFD